LFKGFLDGPQLGLDIGLAGLEGAIMCQNLFDFDFEISRGQFLNVGAFLLF
jgi:hypothetical protein